MIETGVEKEDVRGLLSEVDVDSGGRPWTPGSERGLRPFCGHQTFWSALISMGPVDSAHDTVTSVTRDIPF